MVNKKPKIFLSGGGTLGSVMPLYALSFKLREEYDIFWVGGYRGLEKRFLYQKNIKYLSIPSGKWRKHFSLKNLLTPILVLLSFLVSIFLLIFYRPKLIVVSGSFVSVPLVWAGWFIHIPVIVHQEDIELGLSAKLTFPFASVITTAFLRTLEQIKQKNKKWIGNPVRIEFLNTDKNQAKAKWKKGDLPLVIILGGGLGSQKINQAIKFFAPELCKKMQIVHITGSNKATDIKNHNYRQFPMLDKEFPSLLLATDIVISRAGLSTITELSITAKPAILIPLPGVGQMENAKYLADRGAAIILAEENLANLSNLILNLVADEESQKNLSQNIAKIFPSGATEKMLDIIKQTII